MTKKQAKEIYEKYNPVDDVVRCPKGRAKMRKPLDLYAKAAVNLYGIIKLDEFVKIFNSFNEEKTSVDEVYIILLPNVHKFGLYGFFKDYIVHYAIFEDFDWVQHLEKEQGNKPRYLPSKEQFELFEWEHYQDHDHWNNVFKFMSGIISDSKCLINAFFEIRSYITYNQDIKKIGSILEKHNIEFQSEEQVKIFFDMLMMAKNNTRLWENKGHTPFETAKQFANNEPEGSAFTQTNEINPNQLCYCGSGKKYNRCCYLIEKSGKAVLSPSERKLFFSVWLKLLKFVNEKLNVLEYKIDEIDSRKNDQNHLQIIRGKLWQNPYLISEFIKKETSLSHQETHLLRSWEKHFIKGRFILLKHESEYTIFLRADKDEPSRLYAVKGITNSIADNIRCQLPTMIETVLLPFGEKIIYDSLMFMYSIDFGAGMKSMFKEEYVKIKNSYGVITKINRNIRE